MIKKFYLSILTLTALLCFGTANAWGAQSLPYSYGFETDLLELEDGWTKYFGTSLSSNNAECAIVGAAKKTGSYGFRFSSYKTQGANAQYLISPEFSAPNGLDVTFQYAASSTSGTEVFKVGYSTTDADVSSFTWGAEISYKSTSWKAYENSFPAGTKYIAIYYYGNYQYRLYVDDFTFAATPSCVKPTSLTISSLRSTTATFTWTKGKDETSWQYVCLPAADALDWSGAATATSATATISGLTAETDYKFYVRADCGSEQSPEVIKAFTTPCADYATANLPLEENFNDKTAYPDCWSKVAFVSGTTSYPTIYSSNGESGSKSIRFYGGITGTSEQIAILPPIEEATGNLLLSFWYKNGNASSSYGQFVIGYITDPADASTFHQLGNALTRNTSGTEVTKFAMTGAPENSFIAIKYAGGSYAQSAYIDNIKVSLPSSCADPSDVNAAAASATSATVSWTENGSATTWNLQYSTDNFATSTSVNGITENPYTLTGLTANTTYKVRVQADCGGDQSDWIASAAFPTPCEDQTGVGYSMNFDSETAGSGKVPGCWQKNTYNDSYPQIYNYYANGGSGKCMYFYGGITGSSEQIAILPPFSEKTNKLSIALYYNNASSLDDYSGANYGQLSIGYITNPADASTFVPKETLAKVTTYTAAEVALVGAPDNAYIAIRYAGGSSTGAAFVDDIVISEVSSCLKPSSVNGSATAYDRASISWTENGSATAWQLRYSSDNGENWSAAIDVNENPYLLTGLSGNNNYLVQVQSVCGVSEYSGWSMASAAIPTPCQPADASDYSETMENATAAVGHLPDCWQYKEKYSTGYPYVYNYAYYAYAGSQCLYFQGGVDESSEQSVLLPEMDQPLNGLTLEFYYKDAESAWSTLAKFTVGYIAADGTTFVPVETLDYAGSYTKYTKDLASVPADAKCLAIRYAGGESSTGYGYIDNVRVYPTPTCAAPTGVTVSNETATTADVAWTENNGATAWKIQLSNDGSVWGDAIDANSNPFTVSGLTPNHTIYYARVKAICGVGDESPNSEASEPFETKCAASALPFNDDFSGADLGCWTKEHCYSSTGLYNGTFRFFYNNTWSGEEPPQYLISPEIDAAGKQVTVEFDYYKHSSGTETFKVGYSSTTKDVSAFTWGAEQTATNTSALRYSENLPVGVKYVAIMHTSDDQYYLYIDNFSVSEYVAPACPAVSAATLGESNVTAHTATVSWTAGGEETAWNLQYKAAGGEWSDVIAISTTPSYDMAGLAENTVYYVRVQANCGEDLSEWTGDEAFSFPTDCEPKAVSKASPWNYDFEDTNDGFMPSCWERTEPYANYGYPVVAEYSYYAQSGDKYLYLRTPGRSGSSYNEDAILPVFNTEIKNLKVSFSYFNGAATSNYGQLAIGYVVGDAFTQVGELLAKVEDYTLIEREMPNDAPDGARIAIRCVGSTKGSSYTTTVYVDDIQVSLKPTCYTPTNLQAVATSDGAVVTWEDAAASEWSLQYQQGTLGWTEITGISSTSYTLTGLTVGMPYEVQVKAVCGVGDESEWSASAEFEPVCNAPSALAVTARTANSATFSWTSSETAWVLQYSTDGENWESANVTVNPFTLNGLAAGQAYQAKIQSACGSDFSNVVEFSTWCDSKLSLPVDLSSFSAMPACWEESPAGAVSFANSKLCFVGEGERFLYLPQTDVNLNLLSATFTFSGSLEFGYIDAPNGAFQAFETQPTSGVELNMEGEVAAAKYIAIRYNGANSWAQSSISAISIRKTPTCAKLAAPTATPGVGSATISWTAGSETAWNLQYKLASATDWTEVAVTENPSYSLTGLEQGVSYKVRVQANCGEELGDWSDEASFTTNCADVTALPFIETFSAALSNCWDITDEETSWYAHSVYGGELRLPGGKAASGHLVKLPNITASLTNAVMTIEYKATEGANTAVPQVGYMNGEDFVQLKALAKSSTSTEDTIQLDRANGKRLALRYDDGTSEGNFDIAEIRILEQVTLADSEDNAAKLSANLNKAVDVTLGRTIFCDGDYNTICLPFDLSEEQLAASPLAGATFKAFKYAVIESDELQVRVIDVEGGLQAGVPYLLKMTAAENLVSPLFKNVTISATAAQTVGQSEPVEFIGTFAPVAFEAGNQNTLFVYTNNNLTWSGKAESLKGFRAYFNRTAVAGAPLRHGMRARIVEHQQMPTGCENINADGKAVKLLENNQVVIIRNGVKYTIQGQKIQ